MRFTKSEKEAPSPASRAFCIVSVPFNNDELTLLIFIILLP